MDIDIICCLSAYVFVPSQDHAVHVGDAATRTKDPVTLTQSKLVQAVLDEGLFDDDEGWSTLEGMTVGVECIGQPTGRNGILIRGMVQLRPEENEPLEIQNNDNDSLDCKRLDDKS